MSDYLSEAAALKALLIKKPTVVICPHLNPDGDAIGSALGLQRVLSNLGCTAQVISPNHYPVQLQWLPGHHEVVMYSDNQDAASKLFKEASLLFCVDFNAARRVDKMQHELTNFVGTRVMIDHHPDPEWFCELNFSNVLSSSTAELVVQVIAAMGFENAIDQAAATAFYTGILTDTAAFCYNASHVGLYGIVQMLVSKDLNVEQIRQNIYNNNSVERLRLLGYALYKNMRLSHHNRIAVIALSKAELIRFNFQPGDADGLVNQPLAIQTVQCAILVTEDDGCVKFSFRSKKPLVINSFAKQHFNGGGHQNAAGGKLSMPFKQALSFLESRLEELLGV